MKIVIVGIKEGVTAYLFKLNMTIQNRKKIECQGCIWLVTRWRKFTFLNREGTIMIIIILEVLVDIKEEMIVIIKIIETEEVIDMVEIEIIEIGIIEEIKRMRIKRTVV